MSSKLNDRATRKARQIFTEAFGDRGSHLFASSSTASMMHTITTAFARHMSQEKAKEVGFHFGDWAHDAALVVALHLFPDRFTGREVRLVADCVAVHLSYHCAALGALLGYEGLSRDGIREGRQIERPTKRSRQRRPARRATAKSPK